MENTANLSLPYIMPSQAQKHVTHNEALQLLDALVHLSVVSKDFTSPPLEASEGSRYIPAEGASGAWSGWHGAIAYYADGGWMRLAPVKGWQCWVEDKTQLIVWDGTAWQTASGGDQVEFGMLGVQTSADPVNRFAVKSQSALFSHDETANGNVHVKLNKASTSSESAVLFQNDWSARAAVGCFPDDHFQIKVSPDGANWKSALDIQPSSADIGIGTDTPQGRVHVTSDSYCSIVVSNGNADNVAKGGMVCGARYKLTNNPFVCFGSWDVGPSGQRDVFFGGGGWDLPDATRLQFFTAPTNVEQNNTGLLRMVVTAAGNVGIGTAAPTARLQVAGSLSKTSGSFDIPHPDPELNATHRLRHCFVEAPTRGENIYRFTVNADGAGTVRLPLPDYWRHLNENPQIWVCADGHFGRAYGVVNDDESGLVITCETTGSYNVLLIGTRKDELARDYFDPLGVEYETAQAEEPS
ncbi:DUF2793 domain-containing protein [Mesorhizobium sp. SB112]|uniref:DUF2793 domain-containing protein n=1 Tax=Mesorhizobium sp. SB112 TaxID=3151853 RepID=UPI0032649F60